MIDACNKIIALKVFSGEKLATIYFWRAVGWNKKGNYAQVIADASEAIRLQPERPRSTTCAARPITTRASTTSRIADFNDALRIGPPSGIIFHNRGNAWRGKGEYAKAIADYDESIKARSEGGVLLAEPRHRRSWRSAISTARSPTSTRRSGSTRHCRSR